MQVIPAILTNNYDDLKNKISLVRGVAPLVQVDICDGKFVPTITWPFLGGNAMDQHFMAIQSEREGMPFWEDLEFELDMMTTDAIENFDVYSKLSPKRIIFHIEMVEDPMEILEFVEGVDPFVRDMIEFAIAKSPQTPMADLEKIISGFTYVQIMGIQNIGYQGEVFDERVLDDIKYLKEKYPGLTIAVDGGVNIDTAPLIAHAGAGTLVCGSAIYNSGDITGTIEDFQNL